MQPQHAGRRPKHTMAAMMAAAMMAAAEMASMQHLRSGSFTADASILPPPATAGSSYRVAWFEQRVDHFNFNPYAANRSDHFFQRYLVDDSAFVAGGPIFAFTGAEGGDVTRLTGAYETPAAVAKKLNGTVLYMESRFFGKSIPASPTGSGIGLLSVEQILRDYMALLGAYRSDVCGLPCAHSPIITFGGSLAGTLSALMRLRAPWLVDAAWASSTPLLGFVGEPSLDQYAWRRQITKNWRDAGSDACVDAVRAGFASLAEANSSAIATAFGTCEAPFDGNGGAVQGIAWGILESSGEFIYPIQQSPIKYYCDDMAKSGGGLGYFAALLGRPHATECLNLTKHGQETEAGRAWDYMACTEVVHPIGSNNQTDFFPPGEWTVEGLNASCVEQFGVEPRPTSLPKAFGLRDVATELSRTGSRIMFAYGTRDPWAQLGVGFQNLSSTLPVVKVEGGSHCADCGPSRSSDTPEMLDARRKEAHIISEWVKEIRQERRGR